MTIRRMTKDELADLVSGPEGENFLRENGQEGFVPERFVTWWSNLMDRANGEVFIAEEDGEWRGVISCFLCPDPYRLGTIAQEGFWYVRPKYRGTRTSLKLFRRFELWASQCQATEIRVGCMAGQHHDSIVRFFLSTGYQPFESHFVKRITPCQ